MDEAEFEKLLYSHYDFTEKQVEAINRAGNRFRRGMVFDCLKVGKFRLGWYYAWTMIPPLEGVFIRCAVGYGCGYLAVLIPYNLYQVFF